MGGPYSAATVANRFIDLASERGEQLTPMQIIKLTYIAHGFSLAINRHPLLNEKVEAWRYGPVVPSLYRQLKHHGSEKVAKRIGSLFGNIRELEDEDRELVDLVFGKYGKFNGIQLSHLTHRKGTPWDITYDPEANSKPIDDAVIQSHYATLLSR